MSTSHKQPMDQETTDSMLAEVSTFLEDEWEEEESNLGNKITGSCPAFEKNDSSPVIPLQITALTSKVRQRGVDFSTVIGKFTKWESTADKKITYMRMNEQSGARGRYLCCNLQSVSTMLALKWWPFSFLDHSTLHLMTVS